MNSVQLLKYLHYLSGYSISFLKTKIVLVLSFLLLEYFMQCFAHGERLKSVYYRTLLEKG